MPKYRYAIYDGNMKEVQTVLADSTKLEGTILLFIVDEMPEMIYNLPPGYSVTSEEVED